MKISDFDEWNKTIFIKTCNRIIAQNGSCKGGSCSKCPFTRDNATDSKHCGVNKKYRDKDDTTYADQKLLNSAKAFKKMVEEEKNKSEEEKMQKDSFLKANIVFVDKVEEFKVGDRVKNINNTSVYFTMKGKIEEVYKRSCLVDYNGEKVATSYKYIEKVEDKQEVEKPFRLKKGMKVITINSEPMIKSYRNTIFEVDCVNCNNILSTTGYIVNFKCIDWEETRKLNEEMTFEEFQARNEVKEEPKEWEVTVKEVVCDYGIYLNGEIMRNFIFNSKSNAELIAEIIKKDLENKKFEFEKKEEPKQDLYVIWNPKGKNPYYKHTSLKDAEKEAERLANANPNQEFYVLKAVGKVKGQVKIEWEK